MSNAGIIIKIEYKIDGVNAYTELIYSGFSAKYSTDAKKSRSGTSYQLKLTCKLPKIEKSTSDIIASIVGKKLNIKFQDGNGNYHYAGNTAYPVGLLFNEDIGGKPGDFNGYELIFTHESPSMHVIAAS